MKIYGGHLISANMNIIDFIRRGGLVDISSDGNAPPAGVCSTSVCPDAHSWACGPAYRPAPLTTANTVYKKGGTFFSFASVATFPTPTPQPPALASSALAPLPRARPAAPNAAPALVPCVRPTVVAPAPLPAPPDDANRHR
jgi:hypothetical protein